MRRATVVLALAALIVGCGASPHRPAILAGGCAPGGLHLGSGPPWAARSNPPSSTLYTVAAHNNAVAFIFGYPLRAGHPTNPLNKILWVVRTPGRGLTIRATPLHGNRPPVTVRLGGSAGPQVYPSHLDVPRAGCWHVALRWARSTDTIDIPYGPSCPITQPGGPRPPRIALQNFGEPIGNPRQPGWYGNGVLWTRLPPGLPANPTALRTAGPGGQSMIGIKVAWNRARPSSVSVAGRRLHGPPARFSARVGTVEQYGRLGFLPSELMFGKPGCWRITARLGDRVLPIILDVPSLA